jgi:hypothetical protein
MLPSSLAFVASRPMATIAHFIIFLMIPSSFSLFDDKDTEKA